MHEFIHFITFVCTITTQLQLISAVTTNEINIRQLVICCNNYYIYIFKYFQFFTYSSYLNPASLRDPAINNVEVFKHLEQSMDQVGLNVEEKYSLFQMVAAVLHLGNNTFEENTADHKSSYIYMYCG